MGKERISVFLDKEQIKSLKALSGATRVKMAEYIREGVDMVLAKYQRELKKKRRKGGVK